MRKLSKIIALLLLVTTCVFANWTGSTSEPASMKKIDGKAFYVITTADELAWFAAQVNSGKNDINAVLANDIVFGKDKNTTGTVNWKPIGKDSSYQFMGILDGSGYTVYGLYISNDKYAGLVGVLGKNGFVKNLNITNVSLNGTYVGGIAGVNNGNISYCNKNGNFSITTEVSKWIWLYCGGIVGYNNGKVSNCGNSGSIKTLLVSSSTGDDLDVYNYVGGIVGYNKLGVVYDCYNRGSLTVESKSTSTCYPLAASVAGGIVGLNSNNFYSSGNIIRNCNNWGSVYSYSKAIATTENSKNVNYRAYSLSGGIVGVDANNVANLGSYSSSYETVTKCYNGGSISAKAEQSSPNVVRLVNTYSGNPIMKASVVGLKKAEVYSGGITSFSENVISNCLNNGSLIYSDDESGIVGKDGEIRNSFDIKHSKYWLNNTMVTGTAENMQKDQFAWILNTCNGTEKNSGVWTRGSDGYPTFANEDSLAIYKIVFNDDGISSVRYTNYQGLVSFPDNPEPAEGYIFSGWFNSEEVKVKPSTIWTADETVNAAYTDASDVYWTINFINADGTLLETKSLQHGSIVEYKGDEPSLASTAQYDYTFKGWDVEPTNATENFDYHAVYDSSIRSYTIIFKDYDGSVIQSSSFLYGKTPTCMIVPKRSSTEEFNYSHSGWTPAVEKVTGEATYTAIYEATKVKYTVTFMNGSTVIEEQFVDYGSAAVAPSAPTRDGYKFVGWNVSFANVTKNLTVKALFEELVYHTVVVVVDKEKNSKNVEENDKFELPVAPEKDGYAFEGWYDADGKLVGNPGDKIAVTEDLTLEAKYTVISYTITFANENGSEISSEKVAYGQMPTAPKDPTKASTAQYTYSFKGWNPAIESVTGAATYTAVFDSTLREYTVTFKNGSTTLQMSNVAYGTKPSYTGTTPTKASTTQYSYSFKGWSPTLASVTGAATYTAVFDSTLREYTVTFKNGTTTLQTSDVAYGTKPSYTGTTPTKVSTDKYSYTFKGWNPALASVTGAATYTAVFDSTLRKYTITFKNGSTTLQTSDVAYGMKPNYTGSTPNKKATNKYTYEFKGWNPTIVSVTKDATYQAVFDSSKVTGIIEGRLASLGVSVRAVSRSIQISAASIGSTYAILDIQGRVLLSGRVESANFNIAVPKAGNYLVRVGNVTRIVQVK
ncbi:MAG: InlB B-repeat-containing protein [Fibrobacter sp.]|nr:InlB B-repeat-containing protein [Fibrobacter sp.]